MGFEVWGVGCDVWGYPYTGRGAYHVKTWPSVVKATEVWLPQQTFINFTPLSWSSLVGVDLLLSELGPRPSFPQLLSPHDHRQPRTAWFKYRWSTHTRARMHAHTHKHTACHLVSCTFAVCGQ